MRGDDRIVRRNPVTGRDALISRSRGAFLFGLTAAGATLIFRLQVIPGAEPIVAVLRAGTVRLDAGAAGILVVVFNGHRRFVAADLIPQVRIFG